jgi:hypothetical protein
MLRVNDIIYSIHKVSGKIEELRVTRTSDRHAWLSNGKKISVNNNDGGLYWEIPKSKEQQYTYLEPNDDIVKKYKEQLDGGTFWSRLSEFDAVSFFSAPKIVLLFALALLLGQSFHSFHTLFSLAGSMHPVANWIFSGMTAIFLDGILLFHIARGNKFYSWAAFITCFLLNTYSYHIGVEYWTYESWFSFVPAFAIPFFLHSIGVTMKNDSE